jgi:hypothetical protein
MSASSRDSVEFVENVRATVLRLATFLCQTRSGLRWGCQFFDSRSDAGNTAGALDQLNNQKTVPFGRESFDAFSHALRTLSCLLVNSDIQVKRDEEGQSSNTILMHSLSEVTKL